MYGALHWVVHFMNVWYLKLPSQKVHMSKTDRCRITLKKSAAVFAQQVFSYGLPICRFSFKKWFTDIQVLTFSEYKMHT